MVSARIKQWLTMLGCGAICGIFMWIAFATQFGIDIKAGVGALIGGLIVGALMQLMT
jgi:hypothetical protein